MNVLIIGGSGFVSGTLAKVAVSHGHRVWAVTRGQRPMPEGVTPLQADRHDDSAFEQALAAIGFPLDLVVDCIGYEPADAEQDIRLFRDRAKQLVFVSTDFVFDPSHRAIPQPEESDHYLADGYGGKKRQCELRFIEGDTGAMEWTIFRPCHIYGSGSRLGCLPLHGRDAKLIERLRAREALQLVGGGYFLQQPIFARDLGELILSACGQRQAFGGIFNAAGPDIIESRTYYRLIAEVLGVTLKTQEYSIEQFLAEKPESRSFICHRVYDLGKLRRCGLKAPSTPISLGLREHVESLLCS